MENKIKNLVEGKLIKENKYWSSSVNVRKLSEKIFSWTDYNFLPNEELPLDGHYTFFLNYETFDWRLYKSSDYGGLTWTSEVPFKRLLSKKDFNKKQVKNIEHHMACKILNAYYYDSNHINHKGKRLIDTKELGGCGSLICDNRGDMWDQSPEVYNPAELQALKEMIGFELKIPEIKISFKERTFLDYEIDYSKKVKLKNRIYFIPIEINGLKVKLVHEILFSKQTHTRIEYNNQNYMFKTFSNGLAKYIKSLPIALSNYADSPFKS